MIDGLKPYAAMKDSGTTWLGDVPAHWDVRRLGQLGTFTKGRGGNKEDEVSQGIPCVRYGDLYTTHEYFIHQCKAFLTEEKAHKYSPIEYGDLLFAASGETADEIGKSAVNLLASEARCGGDVILFRPRNKMDPRYLGYAADCHPAATQKASMGRGFTVVHIYPGQLKRLQVALPSLQEQAAIVRFLDHADRRIKRYLRAKEKLVALLEEQKQAIIHEAVTGRIDVRTGKPYPAYKDSGVEWLGNVPEHWEVRRLGQIGTLLKGRGGSKEDEVDEGVPCVRYGDLYTTHAWVIAETRSSVAQEKAAEYTFIRFGDVLFAASGETVDEIGKSAVNLITSRACCGGDIILFRPCLQLDPGFMGYAADCRASAEQKARMGRGFTVVHIYPHQIKRIALTIPPILEQSAIARFLNDAVASTTSAIECTNREIDLLREYRARLIADVVTGKLDVRASAAALPEEPDDPDPVEDDWAGTEVGDVDRPDRNQPMETPAIPEEMAS